MKVNFFRSNPMYLYGAIFLIVLCIVALPLSNTVRLVTRFQELQSKTNTSAQLKISRPQKRDKLLLQNIDYTRKVVDALSESCKQNHVILKQVELPLKTARGKVSVRNQQIVVEGSFVNILKSLDAIVEELEPIKVSSIVFRTETDHKVKTLMASVIFQSVNLEERGE